MREPWQDEKAEARRGGQGLDEGGQVHRRGAEAMLGEPAPLLMSVNVAQFGPDVACPGKRQGLTLNHDVVAPLGCYK